MMVAACFLPSSAPRNSADEDADIWQELLESASPTSHPHGLRADPWPDYGRCVGETEPFVASSDWEFDVASPKLRRETTERRSARMDGRPPKRCRRGRDATLGSWGIIRGVVRGWLYRWARRESQRHAFRRFVCETAAVNCELYGVDTDSSRHGPFCEPASQAWELLSAAQQECFSYEPPYRDARVLCYPWWRASADTEPRDGRVLRISGYYSRVSFGAGSQEWICNFHIFPRHSPEVPRTMAPHLRWFHTPDADSRTWEAYDERTAQLMRRAYNFMVDRGFRGIWTPPPCFGGGHSVFDFSSSLHHVHPAGPVRRIAACDCEDLAAIPRELLSCFSSFSDRHRLRGVRIAPSSYDRLRRAHPECAEQIGGTDMCPIHVLGVFELQYADVQDEAVPSSMLWYGCHDYEWLSVAIGGLTAAIRKRPRGWRIGAKPPEPGVYVYRSFASSRAQCVPMTTESGEVYVHMLCEFRSDRGVVGPDRIQVEDEDLAIPRYVVVWVRATGRQCVFSQTDSHGTRAYSDAQL